VADPSGLAAARFSPCASTETGILVVKETLPMALEPVTLTGQHVELVPLSREHHDALQDAVRDG
jgi:hypothetical protein